MEQTSIFSATLGLSRLWQITSVTFSPEGKRMDIAIDFMPACSDTCPTCGAEVEGYEPNVETWFHDDFFHHETYLHVRVPRSKCFSCGVVTVERPWSRAGSRFSLMHNHHSAGKS